MGLFSYSQIDRDFTGGIYLSPMGELPPLDHIETVHYEGDLYLPLNVAGRGAMEPVVAEGKRVSRGALLAQGGGYYIYAPRAGRIGPLHALGTHGKAITLHPTKEAKSEDDGDIPTPNGKNYQSQSLAVGSNEMTEQSRQAVWKKIEQAGIVVAGTGKLLSVWLKNLLKEDIAVVVANATPLEPSLNGSLAISHHWPDEVFAGLSVLQAWLGADDAIMACPHNFAIDTSGARDWRVRCVPVSEKYPQGRAGSVLKTLDKMGKLPKFRRHKRRAVVFEVQLLYQVEQAVLAGKPSTERIVTISGDGVKKPSHFLAPLGLPLSELLQRAQIFDDADCVVKGSSLAGRAIEAATAVVGPMCEAYTVVRNLPHNRPHQCIRCGWCIDDCPAEIDPARLMQLAKLGQYHQARQYGADYCIECGICSYICPAHLQIMEHIRMIKFNV